MKKKRRTKRASYWGMAAKSTARDWGFGPAPGKGGKTVNHEIPENIFQRELKERGGK